MTATEPPADAMSDPALVAAARAARAHAHAPYSRFAVGAACRLADGSIVTGSNFENASYGLSLCAETVALAAANAQGRLADVVALAVSGGPVDDADSPSSQTPITPCGRCRQVLAEAAQVARRDLSVYCASATGDAVAEYRLSDLLPHAFGAAALDVAPEPKES